MIERSIINSKT
jgi:hypothetical protein